MLMAYMQENMQIQGQLDIMNFYRASRDALTKRDLAIIIIVL